MAKYSTLMDTIVGRKTEIEELERVYHSDRAELVAVYGRRRVGKTFLIKHVFQNRFTFQHTGVSPVEVAGNSSRMRTQLESFYYSLLSQGLEGCPCPKSWLEAFYLLEKLLTEADDQGRQVVFLDELPWMDTPRSGFLSAFENFWNGWCSGRDNIVVIICGSATSWILSNIARSKGGLYGRLTHEIKLSPFTLKECEAYFQHEQVAMSRYDVLQSYMIFGGIPYYLSYFRPGLSLAANADKMLFGRHPKLTDEFNRLFGAIFTNPEDSKKIVRLLAKRHSGFTRDEISKLTGLPFGGGLSTTLTALEESDFIARYTPYGSSQKQTNYKLTDNFCLFWLKYVEPHAGETHFLTDHVASDILRHWRGVAFEEVCWQHADQMRQALGIAGVRTTVSAWNVKGDDEAEGTQIDLLIVRDDNVVNLCEMKFSAAEYVIDKDEERRLQHRISTLQQSLSPRQTIHLTFVTTYGITYGKYSGIIQKSLTMDDLFM